MLDYKILDIGSLLIPEEQAFNALGEQGWRLVTVSGGRAYFERTRDPSTPSSQPEPKNRPPVVVERRQRR